MNKPNYHHYHKLLNVIILGFLPCFSSHKKISLLTYRTSSEIMGKRAKTTLFAKEKDLEKNDNRFYNCCCSVIYGCRFD